MLMLIPFHFTLTGCNWYSSISTIIIFNSHAISAADVSYTCEVIIANPHEGLECVLNKYLKTHILKLEVNNLWITIFMIANQMYVSHARLLTNVSHAVTSGTLRVLHQIS